MRDLYIKRNELCSKSNKLQVAKWDIKLSKDKVTDLIKKQDDVYKRYKFYDNYIKIRGEMKNGKILCIEEKWILFIWCNY